jgi:hypothetical protein
LLGLFRSPNSWSFAFNSQYIFQSMIFLSHLLLMLLMLLVCGIHFTSFIFLAVCI